MANVVPPSLCHPFVEFATCVIDSALTEFSQVAAIAIAINERRIFYGLLRKTLKIEHFSLTAITCQLGSEGVGLLMLFLFAFSRFQSKF